MVGMSSLAENSLKNELEFTELTQKQMTVLWTQRLLELFELIIT